MMMMLLLCVFFVVWLFCLIKRISFFFVFLFCFFLNEMVPEDVLLFIIIFMFSY